MLDEVIDIDQSRFVPGRSTQHAIATPLLKLNLQLVAVDIESVFDSIGKSSKRIHASFRLQQRFNR